MIAVVFGTRPEAIKLGPVVAELRNLGAPVTVICSGQHRELLAGTPAETDLAGPSLGLASDGNVARWMAAAQDSLIPVLADVDVVVVQGDTMTALAAAQAANALGIPLAHVEAGLRSGNSQDPWPEEKNRTSIGELANWHGAPTMRAAAQLHYEQVRGTIVLTGNTIVSALTRYAPDVKPEPNPEPLVLVTLHRREIQNRASARELYAGVFQAALANPGLRFAWPIHPGFAKAMGRQPAMPGNVSLTGPMGYRDFVSNVARAKAILTDSGGLVEEAATLGTPTAILRNVNDRPEAVAAGIAALFSPTAAGLSDGLSWALAAPRSPQSCFGGPEAARVTAEGLAGLLAQVWVC